DGQPSSYVILDKVSKKRVLSNNRSVIRLRRICVSSFECCWKAATQNTSCPTKVSVLSLSSLFSHFSCCIGQHGNVLYINELFAVAMTVARVTGHCFCMFR